MSWGAGTPKTCQDRLLSRGGAGRATRSSGSERKEKGRGQVLGCPSSGAFVSSPPSLLLAAGGLKGREVLFGGLRWGEKSPQCLDKAQPRAPAVFNTT